MRILAVAPALPYPPDHGQRVRTWGYLSRLAAADGVDVTLLTWREDVATDADEAAVRAAIPDTVVLPLRDVDLAPAARAARQARFAAGGPPPYVQQLLAERMLEPGGQGRRLLAAAVDERHAARPFDVVLTEDEAMVHVPVPDLGVPLVAHRLNVFTEVLGAERRLQGAGRLGWVVEGRGWRRFDEAPGERAALHVATTEESAAALRRLQPWIDVVALTNGVDMPAQETPPEDRTDVAFIGWMGYGPNADAVRWFAAECWPVVRRSHPGATFRIVGREPTPEVQALHDPAGSGVVVTGEVPAVPPACEGVAVGVAPLRAGMGIKNKVLELMAMGVPVVAAPAGAEGIAATEADGLVVRASSADLAAAVIRFLDDRAAAGAAGAAARRFVVEHFSWDTLAERLLAELRHVIDYPARLRGD